MEKYFDQGAKRTYDMINFLDFYGRKFKFLNVDHPGLGYNQAVALVKEKCGEKSVSDRSFAEDQGLIMMADMP